MWWTYDYRCKTDCHSVDVEIPFEMFLRYLVAPILNRSLSDVLPHIRADVCLHPRLTISHPIVFGASSPKHPTVRLHLTLRRPTLALGAPRPVTTSTRIPILSPKEHSRPV